MENQEQGKPAPEVQKKKTWQEPMVEVISRGEIEGGPLTGLFESSTIAGQHGSIFS